MLKFRSENSWSSGFFFLAALSDPGDPSYPNQG